MYQILDFYRAYQKFNIFHQCFLFDYLHLFYFVFADKKPILDLQMNFSGYHSFY